MRTKIGTALDRDLLRRARTIAAHEGKRLNQVIEEALDEHLKRKLPASGGVARRTAGSLATPRATVARILREEPGLLEK